MGIFSDYAEKYFDIGLNVIPVGGGSEGKGPLIQDWSKWCIHRQSESDITKLINDFPYAEKIGLPLGPATGLVAFDFDYGFNSVRSTVSESEFKKDLKMVERYIMQSLPLTPVRKKGKKGFTNFYKYNFRHSTKRVDRNGIRVFDFLSSGTQTVIPPSFHSVENGTPLIYQWLDEDLLDAYGDIPELDPLVIHDLADLLSDSSSADKNSRHYKLFYYGYNMAKIEKDEEKLIELLIKKDIELFSSDPKGPYLLDDHHHKTSDGYANAKHWLKRIVKYSDNSKDKKASTDKDSWVHFFENKLPFGEMRKDILSEKIFYRDDNDRWIFGEELIPVMRCDAKAIGLPKSDVEDQFLRFQTLKKEKSFLCDIMDWDGKDYLRTYVSRLNSKDFSHEELYDIFKYWGVGIFKRIYDSGYQNECIILKGDQGIGKDRWIKNLVSGIKPYYQKVEIRNDPSELVDALQRVFVAHIDEFDKTSSLSAASLKSMITNPSTFMRLKYARGATEQQMRASWICSANVDDLLKDPTGNRRFIVIDLNSVDHEGVDGLSPEIIGELYGRFLKKENVGLSLELKDKIKAVIDRYTPDDTNDVVLDYLAEHLRLWMVGQGLQYIKLSDAVPIIYDASRYFGISVNRVQRIAKVFKNQKFMVGKIYTMQQIDAHLAKMKG